MRKFLWLFLLFPSIAFGQGARFDGVAQRTIQNFIAPIPGAQIVVCTSAGTGTPCTPTTPIYTDAGLTQLITGSTITADSNGNFGFYAPAAQTVKYSITAAGVTGQLFTVVLPIVGGGAGTYKSINAIQFADQFTAGALTNPTIAAGINSVSTGGTVAAGTYAAEITYIGGSGGESLPSTASSNLVTTGATSIVLVAPQDVQAGAVSFNVYVQTGGAGSFFKQTVCNATPVTQTCNLTTTPLTSGSTPPVSNTATGILAAAQAALSSSPGTVIVPSTVPLNAGSAGEPANGQILFDYRTGGWAQKCLTGIVARNQNGVPGPTCANIDIITPTTVPGGVNVVGLTVSAHAENTPNYFGGPINGVPGNVAALNFSVGRHNGRTEPVWAGAASFNVDNNNAKSIVMEMDLNNATGSLVQSEKGGVGVDMLAGLGPSWAAFMVDQTSASGQVLIGYGCKSGAVILTSPQGACFSYQDNTGLTLGLNSVAVNRIANHNNSFDVLKIDTDSANSSTTIDFQDNGINKWQLQRNTGFDLALSQSVGASQRFYIPNFVMNESTAVAVDANTDQCYGDSTLHMEKCNYHGTGFFPSPQTGNTAGTHSDSGFYQTAGAAGCTTAASIGGVCATAITITWPVAFADANYKVICTPVGPATNLPSSPYVVTPIAASVTINYFAISAAAASWPTVNCTAVHN